jgi:AraC-like DNA-binding protein
MAKDSQRDPRKAIPAPAGYVRFLLRRFGTTTALRAGLLAGTDIDEERLKDAGAEVTLFTFLTLSENLCREVGEAWPLDALPAWSTAMQGALEVAVRSAATVGEALEMLTRFGHVRAPYLALRLKRERTKTRLALTPVVPVGETAWRALSETAVLAVGAMLDVVLEQATEGLEASFPWNPPRHAGRLKDVFPGSITFGARECAIVVPNALSDRPSPFADAALLATAVGELEQVSRRVREKDTLVLSVERLLKRRRQGRLSAEQAAADLGLSRRTLVRRLAESGSSFRALLDADLKQRARALVDEGKLSRDQMASALGFDDPTSFSRACRRWFGDAKRAR